MGTHRVRQERACGDRHLTGRIQTVLEVRDLRTLTEDVTMLWIAPEFLEALACRM